MVKIHKGKYYYDFLDNIKKLEKECFICGTREDIEPHHIRQVKKSSPQYSDMNNIVMLCHKHHIHYHQSYKKVNQKTFALYLREFKDKTIRRQGHKISELQSKIRKLEHQQKNRR